MANNLINFAEVAQTLVGGDVAGLLDRTVTQGTGNLAVNALGLAFAVALAGFMYRRKIFVRV
jgi:outer membrane lipoprotein SlyB